MKWFRRHLIFTNLALIGVEVGGAFLIWFTLGGRQTFGPLNAYAIVCVSVIVASVAALNSMFASVAAHDSLELTRNSLRPFLYIAGSIGIKGVGKFIRLTFTIQNSGSLPAEDVNADIDFFYEDEEVTEDNLSRKYQLPTREPVFSLVFPNSSYYPRYILNLQDENDLELWQNIQQGKTACRVRITYKSLGRKHLTIETEKLAKQEWEENLITTPIPPQKWE
jgi:hypothetical protein